MASKNFARYPAASSLRSRSGYFGGVGCCGELHSRRLLLRRRYENQNSWRYSFFAPGSYQGRLTCKRGDDAPGRPSGLAARLVNILVHVCLPPVVGSALKPASPTPPRGPAPLEYPHEGGTPPSKLPVGARPRLTASRARLAWRLSGFVTNPHE